MDVNDILRRVQGMVGDDAGSFVKLAQIIDLVNDACVDINIETKVTFSVETFPTVAGTTSYSLSSTFISAKRVSIDNFGFLQPISRNQIVALDSEAGVLPVGGSGRPGWYSIEGLKLLLYPTPDAVYTVNVEEVVTPLAVSAGNHIPNLPLYLHPLVAKLCYAALKERDEDYEASAAIKASILAEAATRVAMAQSSQEESYPVVRDIGYQYE